MDRLIQFFQPPKFDDEETTYRARILTIILNYLTLVLILYIGLAWLLLAPMFDRIWLAILSLLVMVVARIIMLRGAVRAASLMLVILVWLLLMTWALFYGGVHAPTYALLTIVVVIATLLLGLRGGLVVALLSGLGGLVSLLVFGTRVITVQYSGETAVITWLGISLLFFACAGLVGIVRQNTENSIKQAYREIAERQRIEHELRMSEEKFAKAFRSSPNALVISELETSVILDINESFETLSGFNRDEVIGRKATEMNFYTTSEYRTQWQQEFMQKGRIRDLEMDLHRKDGAVRLVSLSIEGIELGGVDCVLSIVQDVTETKKAEESLKRYAKKVQRDADRLAMLNEIGRTVSTQQDLPSVLEAIYQQARQRMQIDAFHVGLYHPEINEISYPIMYDEGEKYEMENVPAVGDHFILRIVRSGKPIWINRTEEELATPIDPKGMMGNESRKSASLMYIPLVTPEAIIGVISAQSYTLNAYDEDDLALLSGIGYQVAVA
ncbi:MAG: PAS domain S-box protein, partial [Aquificales bacterium]|nr:PAS domain S-box protein [Aquificales bacterium]